MDLFVGQMSWNLVAEYQISRILWLRHCDLVIYSNKTRLPFAVLHWNKCLFDFPYGKRGFDLQKELANMSISRTKGKKIEIKSLLWNIKSILWESKLLSFNFNKRLLAIKGSQTRRVCPSLWIIITNEERIDTYY